MTAIAEGRLGPLDWFEERSLADGAEAFAEIDGGKLAPAKLILRP